ncbi:hypothetical protein [Actinoplanes sp. NBRC 101535]|uniref:hypothetical protein n=1 Tax=Actinoplanes sp. NBRC 101535 TaxID=3032196 RepID=UPI0024A4ED5A|nr:hypothetical protein [Actinoplanes sp. NBRC 101535]GLY03900.1 hypothetical protein Acsp01_42790 [Actinoplanes sp. NBRC 101535]
MSTYHQSVFTNSGNARVGTQIGHLSGGLHQGAAPALGDLPALLTAAHQRGDIDTETLTAAEQDLETARTATADGQVRTALRRLNGLVGDVAGIGTAVAAILAAAGGGAA